MALGVVFVLVGLVILMFTAFGNSVGIFSSVGLAWASVMAFFNLKVCHDAQNDANTDLLASNKVRQVESVVQRMMNSGTSNVGHRIIPITAGS